MFYTIFTFVMHTCEKKNVSTVFWGTEKSNVDNLNVNT